MARCVAVCEPYSEACLCFIVFLCVGPQELPSDDESLWGSEGETSDDDFDNDMPDLAASDSDAKEARGGAGWAGLRCTRACGRREQCV